MSKISDLIKELCPNGVEYKPIKETFDLFSGMTGVSNKWADDGNCQFIDYMNVYKNNKIKVKNTPYATVKNQKQNEIKKGDLLLTSASEVPEECAISAVIEDDIQGGIFLDDHLFGLRTKEEYRDKINTTFINYYLNSKSFRDNLFKAVRGVTRFYISNISYLKLLIPIPPIEVQEEIVRILDKFCELEIDLEEELEVRKNQYEFLREQIFNTDENLMMIGELLDNKGYIRGPFGSALVKSDMVSTGIPVYEQQHAIYNHRDFRYFITDEKAKKLQRFSVKENDLIISCSGTVGRVSIISKTDPYGVINQALLILRLNQKLILPKYMKYYLESYQGYRSITANTNKSAQVNIASREAIEKIMIPVPNINKQKEIIFKLDKFNDMINNPSEGLPAEIELRRQQYEYYRNKLLSFEEV